MILDTCALLWLVQGGSRLRPEVRNEIDRATVVWISAISAFEIAVKSNKKKLELPLRSEEWWRAAVLHHNIEVIPVNDTIFLKAVSLPSIHSDPADRVIIATALEKDLTVVTADPHFASYGVHVLF